jgi:hypothetical protein
MSEPDEPNAATGPGRPVPEGPSRGSLGSQTWIIVLAVGLVAGLCLLPVALVALGVGLWFTMAGPAPRPAAAAREAVPSLTLTVEGRPGWNPDQLTKWPALRYQVLQSSTGFSGVSIKGGMNNNVPFCGFEGRGTDGGLVLRCQCGWAVPGPGRLELTADLENPVPIRLVVAGLDGVTASRDGVAIDLSQPQPPGKGRLIITGAPPRDGTRDAGPGVK